MSVRLLVLGSYRSPVTVSPAGNSNWIGTISNDLFFGSSVSLSKNSVVGNAFVTVGTPGVNSTVGIVYYGGLVQLSDTDGSLNFSTTVGVTYPINLSTSTTKWGYTSVSSGDGIISGGTDYVFNSQAGNTRLSRFSGGATIIPSNMSTGTPFLEQFGYSAKLSTNGQFLIVGAITTNPFAGGAAYVFKSNTTSTSTITSYTQEGKIQPPGTANGTQAGYSVSISADGTTAALSAPFMNNNIGRVFIYTRTTNAFGAVWTLQATLNPSNGASGDGFGKSIALSENGNYIVIGAPNKNASSGAVYVFKRTGTSWAQENYIVTPNTNPGAGGNFGCSVDTDSTGYNIVIGANNERSYDGNYANQGVVYVYTGFATDRGLNYILSSNSGAGATRFGTSVSMNSAATIVVVGEPNFDSPGYSNNGRICSFKI